MTCIQPMQPLAEPLRMTATHDDTRGTRSPAAGGKHRVGAQPPTPSRTAARRGQGSRSTTPMTLLLLCLQTPESGIRLASTHPGITCLCASPSVAGNEILVIADPASVLQTRDGLSSEWVEAWLVDIQVGHRGEEIAQDSGPSVIGGVPYLGLLVGA